MSNQRIGLLVVPRVADLRLQPPVALLRIVRRIFLNLGEAGKGGRCGGPEIEFLYPGDRDFIRAFNQADVIEN